MYIEAFGSNFGCKKNDDGSYDANWPFIASDGKLWTYPVNDTGKYYVRSFFLLTAEILFTIDRCMGS